MKQLVYLLVLSLGILSGCSSLKEKLADFRESFDDRLEELRADNDRRIEEAEEKARKLLEELDGALDEIEPTD